jgi:hypothetical protein
MSKSETAWKRFSSGSFKIGSKSNFDCAKSRLVIISNINLRFECRLYTSKHDQD